MFGQGGLPTTLYILAYGSSTYYSWTGIEIGNVKNECVKKTEQCELCYDMRPYDYCELLKSTEWTKLYESTTIDRWLLNIQLDAQEWFITDDTNFENTYGYSDIPYDYITHPMKFYYGKKYIEIVLEFYLSLFVRSIVRAEH